MNSALIENVKSDLLMARKRQDVRLSSLLSTVYSDSLMIGKNDGNREVTDDDVIKVVKRFIKGIEETLAVPEVKSPNREKLEMEKRDLEGYLPREITEAELETRIDEIISHGVNTVGGIMKDLKFVYGASVNGKLASEIAKRKLKLS